MEMYGSVYSWLWNNHYCLSEHACSSIREVARLVWTDRHVLISGFLPLLCCLLDCGQQFEVGLIRSFSVKAGMRSFSIIEAIDVASEWDAGLRYSVVCPQIDLLIFDGPPKPLDKNIVAPSPFSIHAYRDVIFVEEVDTSGKYLILAVWIFLS